MSGLIWIQTVRHTDGIQIPERFFLKKTYFFKNSTDNKKACEINYPACKDLKWTLFFKNKESQVMIV